jgi:hypothetical protein
MLNELMRREKRHEVCDRRLPSEMRVDPFQITFCLFFTSHSRWVAESLRPGAALS